MFRRITFSLLVTLVTLAIPSQLSAEVVWSPGTGWRIEGGALSGLTGLEGRNALDLMNKAREKEEKGNYGSALKTYRKVIKKYSTSIYTPEALYRSAKLYLKRKQYAKSFDAYAGIIARYPNTPRFNEIIGEQYRIASALLDGARTHYWGWMPGLPDRPKGIEHFERILLEAPYSDYAPLALMNIARGHQRMNNSIYAIDALDRMINNHPQSLLSSDAYLKLAQTHASLVQGPNHDQAATQEAITYFQDFMILFPGDPNVAAAETGLDDMRTMLAKSKIVMADFYFYKRDNYTAARVFYNEAITVYPDSAVADIAKERLSEVEAEAAKYLPETESDDEETTPKKKKRFFFF